MGTDEKPDANARPLKARRGSGKAIVKVDEEEMALDDDCVCISHHVAPTKQSRSASRVGIENPECKADIAAKISTEDVKLWQNARARLPKASTDELVTIVKVADARMDTALPAWTNQLGECAIATNWQDTQAAKAMLCGLLSLPPHLLRPVFLAAVARCGLLHLLTTFPAALHPSILTLTQPDQRSHTTPLTLSIPADHAAIFLTAAAAASFPAPGLRSISFEHIRPTSAPALPAASAALLVRTLAAHSFLTSIGFDLNLRPAWVHALGDSLALHPDTAHHLREFRGAVQAHPGGCAAITHLLSSLPSIHLVGLVLEHGHPGRSAQAELSTYQHSAAHSVTLSHLTFLSLADCCHRSDRGQQGQEAGTSAAAAAAGGRSTLLDLLPLLKAPALRALLLEFRDGFVLPIPRLLSALHHLTSLRSLILFANHAEHAEHAEHIHESKPAEEPTGEGLPPPGRAGQLLPQLEELTIISDDPVLPLTVAHAFAAHASSHLTHLSLTPGPAMGTVKPVNSAALASSRAGVEAACKLLPEAIPSLRSLRSLELNVLSGMAESGIRVLSSTVGDMLTQLTALTVLSLQAAHDLYHHSQAPVQHQKAVLHAAPIAAALQKLNSLRSLRLQSTRPMRLFDKPTIVLGACSALSVLHVLCATVRIGDVVAVMPKLRRLRQLSLVRAAGDVRRSGGASVFARQFPGVNVQFVVDG